MDWSIQEIAKIAGTTSRTLRHYDDIGLLMPSRTGQNGYRYYDSAALVQLQRILLLRGLGLGLPAISDEVEERWGKEAYAAGNSWWRGMGAEEKKAWKQGAEMLGSDWIRVAESGMPADSDAAQELARRHVEWLTAIPGTPASAPGGDRKGYLTGPGEMYVADPRFAANYGGEQGARFVRDALRVFAEKHL